MPSSRDITPDKRRRSTRGNSSLSLLAENIVSNKKVVFITGAGLSARSGIRPFRGDDGLWTEVVWSNATREAFRRNPLDWYNNFWLKHFPPHAYSTKPNAGHEALAQLTKLPTVENVRIITQNVDGLHSRTKCDWDYEEKLIEAHGRVGLYKCIPESDSETDEESDEEENRVVKLGNRKKSRALLKVVRENKDATEKSTSSTGKDLIKYNKILSHLPPRKRWCKFKLEQEKEIQVKYCDEGLPSLKKRHVCPYEIMDSIPTHKLQPLHVRNIFTQVSNNHVGGGPTGDQLDDGNTSSIEIGEPPRCIGCGRPCPPQALLFDEGYHSHMFYRFIDMEDWISSADVLVFVGTSFAVTVTDKALAHARKAQVPVYNFNLDKANCRLESTSLLNVENIMGDASSTLPLLLETCKNIISHQFS